MLKRNYKVYNIMTSISCLILKMYKAKGNVAVLGLDKGTPTFIAALNYMLMKSTISRVKNYVNTWGVIR
jgi:hypothetical protein